jgi:undecaprenyl-diphosphatase
MSIFQSILLGIVQGVTEFLPISSSAHLVLVPYWLGWQIPADQVFAFDVIVQMGTLVAVIIYFWKDLLTILAAVLHGIQKRDLLHSEDARIGWMVVLATIPAGIAGILLRNLVAEVFQSPMITGLFLLVTAAMLILGEMLGKQTTKLDNMSWKDALVIGAFQAIAIFPGISRSGSTITGGLIRKLDRKSAARFSFLMSIPIMVAAGLVEIKGLAEVNHLAEFIPVLLVGTITAGVVGYLVIKWLLDYLKNHSLFGFSIVCIFVWLATFIVTVIRG